MTNNIAVHDQQGRKENVKIMITWQITYLNVFHTYCYPTNTAPNGQLLQYIYIILSNLCRKILSLKYQDMIDTKISRKLNI